MTSHTQVGREDFPKTCWTLVVAAGDPLRDDCRNALVRLCENYWYPVYAYVRRRDYPEAEAQDLTQDFFVRILEGRYLNRADPNRGRFRSFLLNSASSSSLIRRIAHAPRNAGRGPSCRLRSPPASGGTVSNHATTKRRNISSNAAGPLCCWTGRSRASGTSSPSTGALVTSRSSRYFSSVRAKFPKPMSRARWAQLKEG